MKKRALVTLLLGALLLAAPVTAQAGPPQRASLHDLENEVMCLVCGTTLNVSDSPQADRERAFIQGLIDEGRSEAQIKQALVSQYGPTVLGLPKANGFDLSAYLVPLVVVLALVALMLVLLPRWRRRARVQAAALAAPAPLPAKDAARLDSDLARYD